MDPTPGQPLSRPVIFATGYRQEFSFLEGLPNPLRHRRGVSASVPGLYFVGLSGQTGFASATLRGVGRDAAEVVRHLVRTSGHRTIRA